MRTTLAKEMMLGGHWCEVIEHLLPCETLTAF